MAAAAAVTAAIFLDVGFFTGREVGIGFFDSTTSLEVQTSDSSKSNWVSEGVVDDGFSLSSPR